MQITKKAAEEIRGSLGMSKKEFSEACWGNHYGYPQALTKGVTDMMSIKSTRYIHAMFPKEVESRIAPIVPVKPKEKKAPRGSGGMTVKEAEAIRISAGLSKAQFGVECWGKTSKTRYSTILSKKKDTDTIGEAATERILAFSQRQPAPIAAPKKAKKRSVSIPSDAVQWVAEKKRIDDIRSKILGPLSAHINLDQMDIKLTEQLLSDILDAAIS